MAVLEIEVPPEEMIEEFQRAYRRLGQRVRVPGFRAGHVPANVLDRFVGHDAVRREALDPLIDKAYRAAIQEHALVPVDAPKVDVKEFEDEKPLRFSVRVVVRPEVTLGDFDAIRVERQVEPVTEADIDRAVEDVRNARASWVPSDVPADLGDRVVVDTKGSIEDGPEVDEKGTEGVLGQGRLRKEIEDALIGLTPGEERDLEIVFPEDEAQAQLRGKKARLHVVLHEVKRKELPEVDDAFVAEVSTVATVEEWRADLGNRLRALAEQRADQKVADEAVRLATEQSTVDLPHVMVHRHAHRLLEDVVNQVSLRVGRRFTAEEYGQLQGKSVEDLVADHEADASKQVTIEMVLLAIADAKGLEPSQEEIDQEIARLARGSGRDVAEFRRAALQSDNLLAIRSGLRRDKALRYLIDVAQGKEPAVETAAEGGESA